MIWEIDAEERLKDIKGALKEIVSYPPKGNWRRTSKGYPSEIVYDKVAYERMVRSYRSGLKKVLEKFI